MIFDVIQTENVNYNKYYSNGKNFNYYTNYS